MNLDSKILARQCITIFPAKAGTLNAYALAHTLMNRGNPHVIFSCGEEERLHSLTILAQKWICGHDWLRRPSVQQARALCRFAGNRSMISVL